MTMSPPAKQQDTVPGTFRYTEEVVDLLLHERPMLTEAALRIVDDVEARTRYQRLRPADAYALAEAEVRTAWPALADAVMIMVRMSNAGLLRL
ncbi:hypothetical protein [Geodermatophilus sp. SYSU D00710]